MSLLNLLLVLGIYVLIMFGLNRARLDGNAGLFVRAAITVFFVLYLLKASGLLDAAAGLKV